MSYAVEWIGGGVAVVTGIVLLLLIVPECAAIAIVVAAIAVLVVALVGLVVLSAAALAGPYLFVRSVRRHLRRTKNTMYPLAERDPGARRPADRPRVVGRAHVSAFAYHEPDEAGVILEEATRDAA